MDSNAVKAYDPKAPRKRGKQIRAIEIACKRLSARALQVLEDALDLQKTPDLEYRHRIEAAKEILNRGWGRPKQTVDTNVNVNADESFLEAINAAKGRVAIAATPHAVAIAHEKVLEDIEAEYEEVK